MRVVADSHAIVWFVQGSPRLSETARDVLREAESTDGIVVSVASLVDLWYVTQTTEAVSVEDLSRLRATLAGSSKVHLEPVDVAVVEAWTSIARPALTDPWDRFVVATAMTLALPLVTRDGAIQRARLVTTIW